MSCRTISRHREEAICKDVVTRTARDDEASDERDTEWYELSCARAAELCWRFISASEFTLRTLVRTRAPALRDQRDHSPRQRQTPARV